MSNATELVSAKTVAAKLLPRAPDSWREIVQSALLEIVAGFHQSDLAQPSIDASTLIEHVLRSSGNNDVANALFRPMFFCKWCLPTFYPSDAGFKLILLGFLGTR